MPTVQTRAPKSKATSKTAAAPKNAVRAPTVAAKSIKGSAEAQTTSMPALSAQEREKFIAQAAYYRAEKRGFAPGCELQDWIEAEAEVLRLIGRG